MGALQEENYARSIHMEAEANIKIIGEGAVRSNSE
jgi:hypothetical protein